MTERKSFDLLWWQLVAKHPKLGQPRARVEISADELRSLCQQFYVRGRDESADLPDLLAGLFRGGFSR